VKKQVEILKTLIGRHSELNTQWDEMDKSDVEFYVSNDDPVKG
jgi:hypothetical protein